MKIIGYIRVSTDEQAEKGQSLEAQTEKLKQYASLYDLDLVEIVVDAGKSAKSLNRPGLQKALNMLKTGQAEGILVTKLDRLTRSVKDLGNLIDKYFTKHNLLSVGEHVDTRTAAGRLVLNILASVSQWEREAIGERTSDVKQHQKKQSKYLGGPVPYGYKVENGFLVECDAEQEIIKAAKELRESGLSLAKVANELDKRGFKSRANTKFYPQQIARLVA